MELNDGPGTRKRRRVFDAVHRLEGVHDLGRIQPLLCLEFTAIERRNTDINPPNRRRMSVRIHALRLPEIILR